MTAPKSAHGAAPARARAFSVSIVHSDARSAAEEAAEELLEGLGGPPDLVFCFFSAELDAEQVVAGLRGRLPGPPDVVGCSSFAEVGQDEALTHSVTALGLRLPGLRWQAFAHPASDLSSAELGRRIAEEIRPLHPEVVFLFPDVLRQNATQLLHGLQSVLGTELPILGGAPADSGTFTRTFQVCNDTVLSGGVCGVALRGGVRIATAARSGYHPVGAPRTATRVESGNILLELDGQPALRVYRDFLGARASEMPAVSVEFPLGVLDDGRATEAYSPLVRAIFRIDEERQALILGGDLVQQGAHNSRIRLLRATREDVVKGAVAATQEVAAQMPRPDVALVFNCMSRKVVLGPRYKEECAAAYRLLPQDLPRAGFYTYGELSPHAGASAHHESTFTLALLELRGEPV